MPILDPATATETPPGRWPQRLNEGPGVRDPCANGSGNALTGRDGPNGNKQFSPCFREDALAWKPLPAAFGTLRAGHR
jgi:hypothetical protein